jgi:hypothetical protein
MPVVIRERHKDVEVVGELACPPESTWRDGALRWFVLEAYKLDRGGWLIHRVGMSLVYHVANTKCRTRRGVMSGDPVTSKDELPEGAEPCQYCKPPWPEQLGPSGDGVRFEFPRPTWNECATRKQVVMVLTGLRSGTETSGSIASAPVGKLLSALIKADPEFADQAKPVRRYG